MDFGFLRRIFDVDIIFEKIRAIWIEFHQNELKIDQSDFNVDTTLLNQIAAKNHSLFAIFDHTNFKMLFVGKNAVDFCGYSDAEIMEKGMLLIFKMMTWSHLYFFINTLIWTKQVERQFPGLFKENKTTYNTCGLTFRHKNGHQVKIIMRNYQLEVDSAGNLAKSIVELTDVTNLLKTENYWTLVSNGRENICNLCFFSDNRQESGGKLMTKRELEILELIAQSLSTKDIADRLFLSPATVEKHRKNMIARVGAHDTMALVEICKRCDVI